MKNPELTKFSERPSLRHLKRLTTKGGIIQHADHEVPDPSFGYSIDDNARALIVCLWHYQAFQDPSILQLAEIYFRYIERVEKDGGSFHNFLSFLEKTLDAEGSADSIGRTVWALGETIAYHPDKAVAQKAKEMLERTQIDQHLEHSFIHTKAYILSGLLAAGKLEAAKKWAEKLAEMYDRHQTADWPWFENSLRYANGIFPYVMAKAAAAFESESYQKIATVSFDWLNQTSHENGLTAPIGQDGWYFKGAKKALYDQQPLEAADMILAACELYSLTGDQKYQKSALEWYGWYEGSNLLSQPIINSQTGGIYDGLIPTGVNQNQGAESIVTYLMAYLALSRGGK